MKYISLALGALVIIGLLAFFLMSPSPSAVTESEGSVEGSVVTPGTYTVTPEQSEFRWAGQKPLIDGYVNSGTIALNEGSIVVGENEATGTFTLDMNSIHVGLTAQKPGQEGALEGHLKGERWFNVETYPTATFVITSVAPTETELVYTVTGDLTLKGTTNAVTFPARIYQTPEGLLKAEADLEIDRILWGITAGSGNFFEDLGDSLIDDMVLLSFSLTAEIQ